MQRSTLAKRAALIFFLAAAAFYFYGLSRLPLIGPDEPRYAQVAREMYQRGDMVTPTLGGHTWFEKPALLYWMMMGSYRLFGVYDWAARLGSVICGLLTVLFIYWMGRRVEKANGDERDLSGLGLWSGVALFSSFGLIIFMSGASFDIVVTMTSTLALCCFFVSEIDEKRRLKFLAGFYAAVGASLLAKGLVGIVVPFGVIGLYYLLRRKWPGKTQLISLLWGAALTLVVAALWYAPVIARHGWTFIDEFFIQHHFARYVSNKYHHPQPFYFYLPVMLLLVLPWTAFLIAGLARVRRWRWRDEAVEGKFRVFALAWLIAPVVFFSFSGSKLPGYVLPALPGAALLVGERLTRFMKGDEGNVAMFFTGIILLLLALAGVVYAMQTNGVPITGTLIAAVPLALAGIVIIALKQRGALRAELICCAVLFSLALALNLTINQVMRDESTRDLIRAADARGYASTPVFYMLAADRTAEFYAGGRLGYKPDGEPFRFDGAHEVAAAARERGGTALVLIPNEWEKQLTDYSDIQTEKLDSNGTYSLFVIHVR